MPSTADISPEWGDRLYAWGWTISICAAAAVLIGVFVLFLGTRVRDRESEEKLSRANTDAADAIVEAARLNERAAALENETTRLTASNLGLATNLERERAARSHIEEGLATRHISAEQRTALADALRGVKLDVIVSRYNDPEAKGYAAEVISALTDAGQVVELGANIISDDSHFQGFFVEETADPRLINALIAARLVTQKLRSEKNPMLRTGEGLNAVLVGLKPNPF